MNKVLVFCSDVIPLNGLATSGGGLRSLQIIEGLRSAGLEVVYSMPWNRFLRREFNDRIPNHVRKRLWTDSNQDEIIKKEKPDVIVCVKPSTRKWFGRHEIPLAIDFHGPDLIEFEQMAKVYLPQARYTLATRKLQSITQGDFFTCAGRRQRYYFMAFLMMAGVDISDLEIHYMPVAMPPHLPDRKPDWERRSIVFSGGFYPWLNPIPALNALSKHLRRIGAGHLEIYGGSHETNPEDKQQFEKFKAELSENPFVSFHGFVPREDVLKAYRRAYAAFELMPKNVEREMAFTTRTVEYLWAGLPVIYNDYAELSELIGKYQAGWLVSPDDFDAIAEVLEKILDDPDEVAKASENAQRLVKENLLYNLVIEPLAEFCRNPTVRKRTADGHFLVIPSRKRGFGYIDHLYLHYRRLAFGDFLKALYSAAALLAKNRLKNR
jgi:glycosyltransferase involved in cell wall biosynthesis